MLHGRDVVACCLGKLVPTNSTSQVLQSFWSSEIIITINKVTNLNLTREPTEKEKQGARENKIRICDYIGQ